jgi:hypothetical protein
VAIGIQAEFISSKKIFHRLTFTPPSLVSNLVLQVVSEPVAGLCDSNQSKIHKATEKRVFACEFGLWGLSLFLANPNWCFEYGTELFSLWFFEQEEYGG